MRNTFLVLSFTLFTLTTTIHAQPDSLWSKTFGGENDESCYSLIQTADGGYALAGDTRSFGTGRSDMWLIKTNEDGDSLWSRTYGGEDYEKCCSFIQNADGGFALAGYTTSFGAGNKDFWLVVTDENGEELWSQTYGGQYDEYCNSIIPTADGGFALMGYTDSFGEGSADFWIIVTDNEGDSLWSKTYGGEGGDVIYSATQTTDGGFAMAGHTWSYGEGLTDFWLVVTDDNGEELWSQSYGGRNYDICYSVIQATDKGIVLAGLTGPFAEGGSDFWLVVTDENGDVRWCQMYGSRGYYDFIESVIQTPDNGFTLAGATCSFGNHSSDFWLIRTNENGNHLWSSRFGGEESDVCNSVIQTRDGGYVLAGKTNSFGAGGDDFWLVKTGPDPVSVSSEPHNPYPSSFILQPAYPNPFNSFTNIRFDLPVNSDVSITVFDLNGRSVATLLDEHFTAGNHSLTWDAKDYTNGMYLCKMEAGGVSFTRKLLLIK
jgi:hypothetical protein